MVEIDKERVRMRGKGGGGKQGEEKVGGKEKRG